QRSIAGEDRSLISRTTDIIFVPPARSPESIMIHSLTLERNPFSACYDAIIVPQFVRESVPQFVRERVPQFVRESVPQFVRESERLVLKDHQDISRSPSTKTFAG